MMGLFRSQSGESGKQTLARVQQEAKRDAVQERTTKQVQQAVRKAEQIRKGKR